MSKPPRSCPCLDGISRRDLPRDLVVHLIQVYEWAEAHGEWPAQSMEAIVSALEKVGNAERVGQFRPITVLSMCYRVYSSIRARQALRHIASFEPAGLKGMLPQPSAGQIWCWFQALIERSRLQDIGFSGCSSELHKALNLVPRPPIWLLPVVDAEAGPLVCQAVAAHC